MTNQHESKMLVINNRFIVHKQLGEGGFGKVFLVYDRDTDEICALKLLRPELAAQIDLQEQFRGEAMIWMEFERHPNIVNVRAVDIFNGSLFIALQFIPPGVLGDNCIDEILRNRRISQQTAIKWAIELCDALIHAKSKGMIAHRDLKPSNLMIDSEGVLKVTDFGLALFDVDPTNRAINISPSGTPAYMPPEQFRHDSRPDNRSDIYSFGIVLFEILTGGHLPFRIGKTDPNHYFEYFYNLHLTYELPIIDTPLYPIIEQCLRKSPEQRYQSFKNIRQDLLMLFEEATGSAFVPISKEEMNASEHNNYAVSYHMLGDLKRANKHIDLSIRAAPYYAPAYNNKAAFLADIGQVHEAVELWTILTKHHPELARPFYNIGNYQMQIGRTENAIRFFKKTIEREPDFIPAIVNTAIAYQKMRDAHNANEYYNKAIYLSPSDAQIHYNYGFFLYEVSDYQNAISMLSEAVRLNPRHLSAFNYLGLCHLQLEKFEDAIGYFDAAIEIDPSYKYAHDNRKIAIQAINKKKGIYGRMFGKH